MSIEEKVNRNNLARATIACELHNYQPPLDQISSCKNCGMQIIILEPKDDGYIYYKGKRMEPDNSTQAKILYIYDPEADDGVNL